MQQAAQRIKHSESAIASTVAPVRRQIYYPCLDGLRAISIVLVLLQHFFVPVSPFQVGGMGVIVFFVLSGFLITSILLQMRTQVDSNQSTLSHVLKTFYIRRGLRIFPIYYLALTGAVIFNLPHVRESVGWHLTYQTNNFLALTAQPGGSCTHFWSLAVEEQFYLIWPAVLMFVPYRYLVRTIGLLIATAIACKLIIYRCDLSSLMGWLMPCCLDALGAGALLAVWLKKQPNLSQKVFNLPLVGSVLLLCAVAHYCYGVNFHSSAAMFLDTTLDALLGFLLIGFLVRSESMLSRTLSFKPLVALGKISYGVYVYHLLVGCVRLPIANPCADFAINSTLSILVAVISWKFLESKINTLKTRFR